MDRSNDKYIINELEKQSQLVVDATACLTKIAETSDQDLRKSSILLIPLIVISPFSS